MSADSGKPGRLYQQVAESIAGSITAGQYSIGQRLPAERDLATEFGVSRATVREAIIALEIEGLVDVKVGSGVYVTAVPRTEGVPLPMDVGPFELIEARLMIEGEVAALAARQATAEDLERLESALRAMERGVAEGDATAAEAADHDFHLAIANATHNSAMASVVESLWAIRQRSPQSERVFERSRSRGTLPVVAEHRLILDGLRNHDAETARRAMHEHLRRVLDYLLEATEMEALEEARRKISARRQRYATGPGGRDD
jgi:GntR family transcriptional repressor for pyruvate dehydrogenase complex